MNNEIEELLEMKKILIKEKELYSKKIDLITAHLNEIDKSISDLQNCKISESIEEKKLRLQKEATLLKEALLKSDPNISYFSQLRGTWSMPIAHDKKGISVLSNN